MVLLDETELLKMVWGNVDRYQKLKGLLRTSLFRPERWGKNMQLTTFLQLAQSLEVPPALLLDTEDGEELEEAYEMVSADLDIDVYDLKTMTRERVLGFNKVERLLVEANETLKNIEER